MDPLSITASIIAVLQATSVVVSICYDYSSAVSGSSSELLKTIEEVRNLRNVLETLEALSRQVSSPGTNANEKGSRLPTLRILCEPRTGILERCLTELTDLDRKLRPRDWSGPAGSKRRALVQATAWPLKRGAVERGLGVLARLREMLTLAITADEAKLIMAIQDTSQAIFESTTDTNRDLKMMIEKMKSKASEDQEVKIYEWLAAPDPSSNYTKARELCQAKSGMWFLQSKNFADWKGMENSLLWLYGIPGCGKTVLSSTIVEDLLVSNHKGPDDGDGCIPLESIVLHFYFDFNDMDKQSHEKMIRSLITQIATRSASVPYPLASVYGSCVNGQRQPTTEALMGILRDLLSCHEKVFLILDALDECTERFELLSTLNQIAAWGLGLHILVTSRREAEIGESLDLIGTTKICIQSVLVDNDIRAYVRDRLHNDWKLRRWKKHPDIQREIEETLMEKSDGMFRWAVCQLDALGRCLTVPMLRTALKSLPITLDETYARILRNIDESWNQPVTRILEWLVYSATPLRLSEVAELVAIDVEGDPPFDPNRRLPEPKDILVMCSSLITMTKEKPPEPTTGQVNYEEITHEYDDYADIDDSFNPDENDELDSTPEESKIIVRLAHFSVKEYLVSRAVTIGPSIQYNFLESPANVHIAETCLIYLFQFHKDDSLTAQTLDSFPLLRYAARNWITHARIVGGTSERLNSLIMEFLLSQSSVYKNWNRVFDPERIGERPAIWQYSVEPCSPLYYCSLEGLLEPVKRLIAHGANVNLSEGDFGCSLLAALKNGHERIARLLVDSGADVAANAPDWPEGMTALHCAARDGYDFLAAELLSRGAAVEAKTDCGETPLHMAVAKGQLEVVRRLLDCKANIEAQDNIGNLPLHDAVFNGDRPMVELLLEKGADIEKKDHLGRTVIFLAVEAGQLDIIHLLLEHSPNLELRDIRGQGLIHYAAASGLPTIINMMLPTGTEQRDSAGRTALHIAVDAGHEDVVHLLLRGGGNIEAPTNSGQTPLFYAAVAGRTSIAQRLIDNGADIRTHDYYGASILYAAASAGEQADGVVDILLKHIEIRSKMKRTLLHHASAAGDEMMVERLIERGADLHARTAEGETPLFLAMTRGHAGIIRLLRAGKSVTPEEDEDVEE